MASATASRSAFSVPRGPSNSWAPRRLRSAWRIWSRSTGSTRMAVSRRISTQTPPRPTARTCPQTGSVTMPTSSSIPPDALRLDERARDVGADFPSGADDVGVGRHDLGRVAQADLDPADVALVLDLVGGELDDDGVAERVGGLGGRDRVGREDAGHDRDPVLGHEGGGAVLRPGGAGLVRHRQRRRRRKRAGQAKRRRGQRRPVNLRPAHRPAERGQAVVDAAEHAGEAGLAGHVPADRGDVGQRVAHHHDRLGAAPDQLAGLPEAVDDQRRVGRQGPRQVGDDARARPGWGRRARR